MVWPPVPPVSCVLRGCHSGAAPEDHHGAGPRLRWPPQVRACRVHAMRLCRGMLLSRRLSTQSFVFAPSAFSEGNTFIALQLVHTWKKHVPAGRSRPQHSAGYECWLIALGRFCIELSGCIDLDAVLRDAEKLWKHAGAVGEACVANLP